MAIEILEIHHTGVRVDTGAEKLDDTKIFYKDVLGLGHDTGRPTIPGIPGAWINVGKVGQIHLIGGEQPSPVAKGPGEDPTRPHIAFAVKDIVATRKELDRMGVKYWVIEGLTSPDFDPGLHERSLRQHGRAAPVRQMPLPRGEPRVAALALGARH